MHDIAALLSIVEFVTLMLSWLLIADPQAASWSDCIMEWRGVCMRMVCIVVWCLDNLCPIIEDQEIIINSLVVYFKFPVCEIPLFLKLVKLVPGLVLVSS